MTTENIATKYNFLDFNGILKDIRNSFLTELETLGYIGEIRFNSRLCRKILRHCVLEEVLKTYKHVDLTKTNVILLESHNMTTYSGGEFNEQQFIETIVSIIDACKRKIPILIKKYPNPMPFNEFISTGDGHSFLLEISGDKERLRSGVCSFKEFKIFAKSNGLRYIAGELLEDIEFKKLFVS
jgi:hypothetical protein